MHRNEHFMKLVKLFITIFLCSEMESTYTEDSPVPFVTDYDFANTVNNSHASLEFARYHASIRLKLLDHKYGAGHVCSGALIASSVVLTAAECVYNEADEERRHPAEFKIVLGGLNRYQQSTETLIYEVTHIYVPATFDSKTLKDNVALMLLDRDIPTTNAILKPVALSKSRFSKQNAKGLRVTSWAVTKASMPLSPLVLYNVSHNEDAKICKSLYRNLHNDKSICINFDIAKEQLCPADTGAPLIHNNQLIGISSIGQDCSAQSLPVMYTDVAGYREWISEMIGDGKNQNDSIWGSTAFLLFTAYTLKRSNLMKF